MNNHPIGIIDSGIGGLSIWKEVGKLLPNESTIYISDAKNLPYGEKNEEQVYRLAKRLVQYLIAAKVKLIVVACNTITVSALDRLRADFPDMPLVGTVPVVKAAASVSKTKRIGVLSTNRTAESEYQKRLISEFASDCFVLNSGTNTLVPMVEAGDIDQEGLIQALQPFIDAHVDTLALGCTHFPFLKSEIQQILGKNVNVMDSGEAVARQVKRILEHNQIENDSQEVSHQFVTTAEKEAFVAQINRLVGSVVNATIEQINL